jgi:tRNA(Ile)-lysidine synthase
MAPSRTRSLVLSFIEREALWPPHSRLVVAVSGGADSLCLLGLLLDLQNSGHELAPDQLIVAHLDHGLRGQASAEDAIWVGDLARSLHLTFFTEQSDVREMARTYHLSIEDAGRRARYSFLRRTAAREGASPICLGHTADDQVETILMHWLRGSGLRGLAGMAASSGDIARPILCLSRRDTLEYCRRRDWEPRYDKSNDDLSYRRNRIRHELLPYLERYNPNLRRTVLRNARLLGSDEAYLAQETDRVYARVCRHQTRGAVEFDLSELKALHKAAPPLARRVIRRGVEHLASGEVGAGLEASHIFQLETLLDSQRTGGRVNLPGNLVAERGYTSLVIQLLPVEDQSPILASETLFPVPGDCALPRLGWRLRAAEQATTPATSPISAAAAPPATGDSAPGDHKVKVERIPLAYPTETIAYLDRDICAGSLTVRTWKRGDRFRPLGMRNEKKLHDFFIDAKIPRELRHRIPLVLHAGRIAWVAGLRIEDRMRISAETKRMLVLQLEPL